MKFVLWLVAAATLIGFSSRSPNAKTEILLVSGDTHGYLQPCGCTKPMQGGILRRGQAIRSLSKPNETVFVDNGGLIDGVSRQDHLKAETLAEVMGAWGVDAVNLTSPESKLGRGEIGVLNDLLNRKFVCSSLRPSETNRISTTLSAGPFVVGGLSPLSSEIAANLEESDLGLDAACKVIFTESRRLRKRPLLLWGGDLDSAKALLAKHPQFEVVVYRHQGTPPKVPLRVGKTLLLTPGERGKHLIRAEFVDNKLRQSLAVELGPEFTDDADSAKSYVNYQDRVEEEKLLDAIPRSESVGFVGSAACRSCHSSEYDLWTASGHAQALKTLEEKNSDRDPDCVECHVVGLKFRGGFQSRQKTPELANVGCESCHGPGKAHVEEQKPLGPATSCSSCHNLEHDPRFDRATAWEKIRH